MKVLEGSRWFRRLVKDVRKIDPYLRVKRIKYGFYRIFWKQVYVHEIYKECPLIGHDVVENDHRIESQKYYEEYEDNAQLIRKIKNYKEGYWDAIDRIRTRVYMMRHNKEYHENASRRFQQFTVK